MDASITSVADIPVYVRGEFLRYVDEHEARRMISRKEVALTGHGKQRRLHVLVELVAKRERALSERDPAGAALSCTYEEELYRGRRTKEHRPVTTGYCVTLKKLRRHKSGVVELAPYREAEGFRRARFNSDRLPQPLIPVRSNLNIPAAWQ